MNYISLPQNDYNKKLKIEDSEILCYSKKQLKKRYPDKDYSVVAEVKAKNRKEEIGQLEVGEKLLSAVEPNTYGKLFWKRSGYVCVGENNYIALLKSRLPFLLILLGLLIGLTIAGILLFRILSGPSVPTIDPYNPLPSPDPYVEPIENDDSVKASSEDGGGSVSMIYRLKANIDLSTGKTDIYFKNPNASNHNVAIQMYIVSGENETLIAQSGLIESGYSLNRLDMIENSANLKKGVYQGKFKVIYYNPDTGERALVESDIKDLEITVS